METFDKVCAYIAMGVWGLGLVFVYVVLPGVLIADCLGYHP